MKFVPTLESAIRTSLPSVIILQAANGARHFPCAIRTPLHRLALLIWSFNSPRGRERAPPRIPQRPLNGGFSRAANNKSEPGTGPKNLAQLTETGDPNPSLGPSPSPPSFWNCILIHSNHNRLSTCAAEMALFSSSVD